ncbi:PREDICTED: protein ABHD13-like [Branchiostoma belcheri]|uniref:Protein ABHD13 n=1 Tax=Branchiostoma belcheri TaxID=7741 RepID=A0A6P4Z822_BRABE|nr:PREDICTED: protein ABHD13-like [Branchiostoma belcheri]KAI8505996.1 Alpha/beta hydrolase domain-containing protein 13 [Branchiostoma belcheri]
MTKLGGMKHGHGHSHQCGCGKQRLPTAVPHAIPRRSGFAFIQLVSRFAIDVLVKCWALCSTGLLAVLLFYWLYGGWVASIVVWISIFGIFYNYQDYLLYYPEVPKSSRLLVQSPQGWNIPFESLFIKARDGTRLHALFLKQPEGLAANAPTVLFLHGNAGNIGHRLVNAVALYAAVSVNVLLLEYRGYGKSDGSPTETGLYLDAEAAVDFLYSRTDINQRKIVVFGRSLGGAVGVHLATHSIFRDRIFAVILENTFTSIPHMATIIFSMKRILKWVPVWMYKNQFLSIQKIGQCSRPTLFVSGLADQLIPPYMMQLMFQESGSVYKRMCTFPTGTHNETWQCEGYCDVIRRFLQEVSQAHGLEDSDGIDHEHTIIDI